MKDIVIDSSVNKKIVGLLKSVDREGMKDLISWLIKDTDFFNAPASTKFHLNEPGGLARHSLSVYETFEKLCTMCNAEILRETKIIVSLLHDVCKTETYKLDYARGYQREDTFPIGHGEKSIILVQQFIKLTREEIGLIRWHMGTYDDGTYLRGEKFISKHFPYALLFHLADNLSTHYTEEEE